VDVAGGITAFVVSLFAFCLPILSIPHQRIMQLFSRFFVYIDKFVTSDSIGNDPAQAEDKMTGTKKLAQPEFRERVTSSILDMLAHLPEAHKKMFIWKHYHGWPVDKIAEHLKCNRADVEGILRQINSSLFQKTGALLT
jgi:DNA-directed RNA polymerase specialized sigma24 family protein